MKLIPINEIDIPWYGLWIRSPT